MSQWTVWVAFLQQQVASQRSLFWLLKSLFSGWHQETTMSYGSRIYFSWEESNSTSLTSNKAWGSSQMYTSTNNRQASVRDSLAGSDQLAVVSRWNQKWREPRAEVRGLFILSGKFCRHVTARTSRTHTWRGLLHVFTDKKWQAQLKDTAEVDWKRA